MALECWSVRRDSKSADDVFDVMRGVSDGGGSSFLIMTHKIDLARLCDKIIEVIDGRIKQ